jgi:hypothetical protein
MMKGCEVRLGGEWQAVGIEDALSSYKGKEMRCVECQGPVCAHKLYNNGVAAHFEHKRAHAGCSQITSTYKAPGSRHPDAYD